MQTITKEYLNKRYWEDGATSNEIAKECLCSSTHVLDLLRRFGMKIRTKKQNANVSEIIGKKFGELTVLKRGENGNDRMSRWVCECSCGKTAIKRARNLKNGEAKSCGHLNFTGYEGISGTYWGAVKHGAKIRELDFAISIEGAWEIFIKQRKQCALSGVDIVLDRHYGKNKGLGIQTASLDRIDSSAGYSEGNIQWVHKDLNTLKMDLSQADFLRWIKLIYEKNFN